MGRSATGKMVDLYHIADYDKEDFLKAMKVAMADKKSPEYTRFYEFLLTVFVEEDHECRGVVSFEAFERLVARAAMVPRTFGLAPKNIHGEAERALRHDGRQKDGRGYFPEIFAVVSGAPFEET